MKKLFVISVLSLMMIACVEAWARPVLHVYNWWNYFGNKTLECFEKQNNVDIVYETYKSNEEMIKRMMTGGDRIYDVVFPTDSFVEVLHKMGFLAPLDLKKIPNASAISPDFLAQDFDPHNKYSLPYQWCIIVIAYRGDKLPLSDQSLSVIFNPEERLKGKIGLVDSMREIIGLALLYKGHSMNSRNPDDLVEVQDSFARLKPFVGVIETDLQDAMLDGSIWIAVTWQGEAITMNKKDPNIHYFIPKEGAIIGYDSMVIPSGALNKELAHKFINYLLNKKVSAEISNDITAVQLLAE